MSKSTYVFSEDAAVQIYIHNVGCTINVNTKVKLNEEGVTIERVRLKRGFLAYFSSRDIPIEK